MTGPCSWPISYAGCADTTYMDDMDESFRTQVEDMATEFLWRWTGRVFGACPVVVRPCRDHLAGAWYTWPRIAYGGGLSPALIGGKWYNLGCGSCGGACMCTDGTRVLRLGGPVVDVIKVLIDGVILPDTAWRVDNHSLLVRTDGGVWPSRQNYELAPTEVGTWQVTYTYGIEVPIGGQVAAGILAVEFAKSLCNDATCALPQRIQSITRQGVSMAVLDSFEDVGKGRTGIWLVDSWVASVTAPPRGGRVFSPDVPTRRRQTS